MSARLHSDGGFGLMRAIERFRPAPEAAVSEGRKSDRSKKMALNEVEAASDVPKLAASRRPGDDGVELWPLPGLAPMTRVRTSFGDVHAIALRKGDEVLLRSGDYRPIEWINRIKLDEHILTLKPDSNPIVLAANALGAQAPMSEIMVSPRQIICGDERSGMSVQREAAMLTAHPGVRRLRETGLSYTMFHVGDAADVYCEGLYLHFPIEA